MKKLAALCCIFISSASLAGELSVRPVDMWTLECEMNTSRTETLTARTTITQPQGFTQVIESPVKVQNAKTTWRFVYPPIDDGRFDVEPGNWNGYWIMGDYRINVELMDGVNVVDCGKATFDPMSLCQRDNYGPICTKYPQQFVECSPARPAYIDTDAMSFTIRTLPNRVAQCTAIVDVTARKSDKVLAGPWRMELTGKSHCQDFDSSGWPRGEYWIRIRLLRDSAPVGPYLIRKVWKEVLPPEKTPLLPRHIGRHEQIFASSHGLESVNGIRFVADALQKQPNRPIVTMDKPWETELLYYKTLHYDKDQREYILEYELAGGDKKREAERAQLPSTMCRVVSKDGLTWTKPALGFVEYKGSTHNNLIPRGQEYAPPRSKDAPASLSHNLKTAKFRKHEPVRDGHVNMQNVFVTSVKESFVNQCNDVSSQPFRTGAWPMEKRGDEYLVLTPEPVLSVGVGMDLFHSTEKITLHVEDKSTGDLYYFFRPGAPSYSPHDAPFDNMHMTRRCLGVMWTRDGLHWDRRLIAAPDEMDPAGAQFYYNSLFTDEGMASSRPAMSLESHWNKAAIENGRAVVGAFTIFDAKANRLWPELVAIGDLLHWHRFAERQKMIENGPSGSYDHGLIKLESDIHEFNNEWWFPYQAINGLHQDYIGLAKMRDAEQLKREFPNYAEIPGFVSWEQYWKRCKTMRYYTGIARCLKGRISHAEAVETQGSLTTLPIVLEGDTLVVNASIPPSGSLRVEVLNKRGTPLPGLGRTACRPITGDSRDLEVVWNGGDLRSLFGSEVRLRFVLNRARLYSYRLR